MGLVEDIGSVLVAANLGTWTADLFAWNEPPEPPIDVLTLVPTPGQSPERTQGGVITERPALQVRVRAQDATEGLDRIYAAWRALLLRNVTLGGTFYQSVIPLNNPHMLAEDPNERTMIAFDLLCRRNPS